MPKRSRENPQTFSDLKKIPNVVLIEELPKDGDYYVQLASKTRLNQNLLDKCGKSYVSLNYEDKILTLTITSDKKKIKLVDTDESQDVEGLLPNWSEFVSSGLNQSKQEKMENIIRKVYTTFGDSVKWKEDDCYHLNTLRNGLHTVVFKLKNTVPNIKLLNEKLCVTSWIGNYSKFNMQLAYVVMF